MKTCTRGEMDITTVFGTVVVGSIPTERTRDINSLTRCKIYDKNYLEIKLFLA